MLKIHKTKPQYLFILLFCLGYLKGYRIYAFLKIGTTDIQSVFKLNLTNWYDFVHTMKSLIKVKVNPKYLNYIFIPREKGKHEDTDATKKLPRPKRTMIKSAQNKRSFLKSYLILITSTLIFFAKKS